MPQLGETVAEGTVTRWLCTEGAPVAADDPLLEVSTDKVDTEVVAPADGVLRRILVPEGMTVPVGTVLALLADIAAAEDPGSPPVTALSGPGSAPRPHGVATPAARPHRHRDSPRVRRLAREHGVDLTVVRRSGPHGRATVADVREAAERASIPAQSHPGAVSSRPPLPGTPHAGASNARGRVERLSRRRKVIAERMHRSLQESAQLTTVIEVDLTHVVKIREAAKHGFRSRYGVSLSVFPFVAEAAVRALADHPVINAELDLAAGTVTYLRRVDLGIAVDTDDGLVVPVIRGAEDLTVGALARHIAHLAARSRDGSATADDLAGGSFTITNTGSRGALFDTPILNAPQSAILGLGSVTRRPVVLHGDDGDELIAIRSMAYLSLTYDHRLVDGADAARYLVSVKGRLESPDQSWLHSLGITEAATLVPPPC
ncbi:2-oxo acid dehydrogenase subunit E2 [Nonomuraea terrae]|uniref:Dihydrolipoamide acetyltransferase component of pyruvate dehydrogenase complex n=2 Tax=Nonomuraea terrae TaxID=2530383 RepID=A0A4R4ZAJ3_9ACTN|nr:2-oxo acid dehydrogenase subunit E2 [Nonomuraea terrae]